MARIRTIKPEFWADEKLAPLDPLTRLTFLGLISQADDAGRLVDNVKLMDGLLFSGTDDSCRDALDTLARLSRITRYTTESGQRLIQITNWGMHQRVDRPSKHVLPGPDNTDPEPIDTQDDVKGSRHSREEVATPSRNPIAPTLDLGPRTMDGDQEKNTVSSLRSETEPGARGSFPQFVDKGGDPVIAGLAYLMPILRENSYQANDTDGSIVRALLRSRVPPDEIANAAVGLAQLRDRGELEQHLGIEKGAQLAMTLLYAKDLGGIQPLWRKAEDEFNRHLSAHGGSQGSGARRLRVEVVR